MINFALMATTIFLVRHGETVDNARQIMQGQTPGELNEQGREQAHGWLSVLLMRRLTL